MQKTDWAKDGYALSTIKIASAVLNGCFKQANKNEIIERNPVNLAQLPREKAKTKKKAMTKEQQQLFMEYAKDSYLYNFFAIMLRTGMRSGEMRGLIYALDVNEYSCAATPQIRQTGNRLSGLAETAYASLLAQCFV